MTNPVRNAQRSRPADNSVCTIPGRMAQTVIPCGGNSSRSAADSPTTPNLVAQYVATPGKPAMPAIDAILIRVPPPRAMKRPAAGLPPRITPRKSISIILPSVAADSARNAPVSMTPALLTKIPNGPTPRSLSSRNSENDCGEVTSSGNAITSPAMRAAASLARSTSRSPMATLAPAAASAVAVANPMPRAPPVTATTRPFSVVVIAWFPSQNYGQATARCHQHARVDHSVARPYFGDHLRQQPFGDMGHLHLVAAGIDHQ